MLWNAHLPGQIIKGEVRIYIRLRICHELKHCLAQVLNRAVVFGLFGLFSSISISVVWNMYF